MSFTTVREPLVRRRLEPEEDVEVLRERSPRLEQLRVAADEVRPRLDEDPALPNDPATLQGRARARGCAPGGSRRGRRR